MDYQQDPAQMKLPWGKIVAVNIVVTLVAAFLFNAAFDFILPSGAFARIKALEKATAELQVTVDKFSSKIKIAN
jgi:hypothetical protein